MKGRSSTLILLTVVCSVTLGAQVPDPRWPNADGKRHDLSFGYEGMMGVDLEVQSNLTPDTALPWLSEFYQEPEWDRKSNTYSYTYYQYSNGNGLSGFSSSEDEYFHGGRLEWTRIAEPDLHPLDQACFSWGPSIGLSISRGNFDGQITSGYLDERQEYWNEGWWTRNEGWVTSDYDFDLTSVRLDLGVRLNLDSAVKRNQSWTSAWLQAGPSVALLNGDLSSDARADIHHTNCVPPYWTATSRRFSDSGLEVLPLLHLLGGLQYTNGENGFAFISGGLLFLLDDASWETDDLQVSAFNGDPVGVIFAGFGWKN